jgi:hypothetical protein
MRQLGVNAAGTTRATRVAIGVGIGVGVVGTVAVAVAALVSASHKAFSLLPITLNSNRVVIMRLSRMRIPRYYLPHTPILFFYPHSVTHGGH